MYVQLFGRHLLPLLQNNNLNLFFFFFFLTLNESHRFEKNNNNIGARSDIVETNGRREKKSN